MNIHDWFNANKLTLNLNKSVLMHFKSKGINVPLNIILGATLLPRVKETKFLGVFIDENLTWNKHTKQLQLKLRLKLCLLRKGRYLLSAHAKKTMYYAQIHSNLMYGILMWGNMAHKADLEKLQKIQNCCVQTINPKMPIDSIYEKLGILKFHDMLKLENSKLWFKYYNGLLPTKLQGIISMGSSQEPLRKSHTYNTR